MSSSFGKNIRVTVFGESHGPAIGMTAEGFPPGETVDTEELQRFLSRRAPGSGAFSTPRKEADAPVFLSGMLDNTICGSPLTAVIGNTNTRSGDYKEMEQIPRPGHADYTAAVRYGGSADMRGGGHFSGRLTAPLCIAGGIALQILARRGITAGAHLLAVSGQRDTAFDPVNVTKEQLLAAGKKPFPTLSEEAGERMQQKIIAAKEAGDSVGGIIECGVIGVPAGLGDPMFDGLENRLAAALFGIPAVKGVEFGSGFAAADMSGSEHNDPFCIREGRVETETNHHGGALGGITTGMPVLFRIAVKPTPSIARPQRSVNLSAMEPAELAVRGRHDPCIAPRAVPVAEACAALVILDMLMGRV